MNGQFQVREYIDSDYEEIIALWEPLGLGNAVRGDTKTIIQTTLELGGKLLLLVNTHNREIVGSSWLTVDGRRTYIHHFGIKQAEQSKGLSKILLSASLAAAKTIGLQVKLEVHQDNTKAINLYTKAGFKYLGDYDVYIIRDILTSL